MIERYFPSLSLIQKERFGALRTLYQQWNSKINLISRKDIDNLYERHVLHSLGIGKIVDFVPETQIIDVGTGGGFPGIPLAILFPEAHFHLIDATRKKLQAVEDIAKALGLNNVSIQHVRAEVLRNQYDFVVGRAVTSIIDFYGGVKHLIRPGRRNTLSNGLLYLTGGEMEKELKNTGYSIQVHSLKNIFEESFFESKKIVYISTQL